MVRSLMTAPDASIPNRIRNRATSQTSSPLFLVIQGEAIIRMRRVLGGPVWEFPVTGDAPAALDIPTLYTHSIENVGKAPLLTLLWTHDFFDPTAPDTYLDPVLET